MEFQAKSKSAKRQRLANFMPCIPKNFDVSSQGESDLEEFQQGQVEQFKPGNENNKKATDFLAIENAILQTQQSASLPKISLFTNMDSIFSNSEATHQNTEQIVK